jgi:hypothetical protein
MNAPKDERPLKWTAGKTIASPARQVTWRLTPSLGRSPVPPRFLLDLQSHLSIFHERLGLIITGANSKRQPELATFRSSTSGPIICHQYAAQMSNAPTGSAALTRSTPFR